MSHITPIFTPIIKYSYSTVLVTGIMGLIFLAINSFVAFEGSSTATPIGTLVALILLWVGVSTPLVRPRKTLYCTHL